MADSQLEAMEQEQVTIPLGELRRLQRQVLKVIDGHDTRQWLDLSRATWCHVPNGAGKLGRATAGRARAKGLKAGVPDILIFDRPKTCPHSLAHHGCCVESRGIAVELKRKGGYPSDVTPEQQAWLGALTVRGWITHVAFGADDAIAWLRSLGIGVR